MHDIHSESVDAAIELIPKLIAEGYQLVTVSEMAAAKGVTYSGLGSKDRMKPEHRMKCVLTHT